VTWKIAKEAVAIAPPHPIEMPIMADMGSRKTASTSTCQLS
jgi:hypothetical protein